MCFVQLQQSSGFRERVAQTKKALQPFWSTGASTESRDGELCVRGIQDGWAEAEKTKPQTKDNKRREMKRR